MKRMLTALAALAISFGLNDPVHAGQINIGGYSFSDELGGFQLKSVRGQGSRRNPFVIVEELQSPGPVILTIRRLPPPADAESGPHIVPLYGMQISLEKITVNKTGLVWVGFDLELQEKLNVPSPHGDGLSFDQVEKRENSVRANRFAVADRLFEPHDRIHFFKGHVNPDDSAQFTVHITDITPTKVFYLLQEPQFLFAQNQHQLTLAAR